MTSDDTRSALAAALFYVYGNVTKRGASIGSDRPGPTGGYRSVEWWEQDADAILAAEPRLTLDTPETGLDGAARIAAERVRQVSDEGYDATHDAGHADELRRAAACYALPPGLRGEADRDARDISDRTSTFPGIPTVWPWHPYYWKPRDDIRDLVRAGALIAAAIDARLAAEEPTDE